MGLCTRVARVKGTQDWDSQTSVNTSYLSPELNLVDLSVSTDIGLLIPVLHSNETGPVLRADERALGC